MFCVINATKVRAVAGRPHSFPSNQIRPSTKVQRTPTYQRSEVKNHLSLRLNTPVVTRWPSLRDCLWQLSIQIHLYVFQQSPYGDSQMDVLKWTVTVRRSETYKDPTRLMILKKPTISNLWHSKEKGWFNHPSSTL